MLSTPSRLAIAATGCAVALAVPVTTASAAPHDHPQWTRTLTTQGIVAPFQMAVNHQSVYVTDGFAGTISRIDGGTPTVILAKPGTEIAGVDLTANGQTMAYTSTDEATGSTALTITTAGRPDVVADLSGYEAAHNPDAAVVYGLQNVGPDVCPAGQAWLASDEVTGHPATYTGVIDSHPYSVASLGRGAWAVADAAGNDILKVDASGAISTIAVLPKQPSVITSELLHNLGAPPQTACLAGLTYAFEPVPTDVEVGPRGTLYVSTLPGGPEDPSAGARGSVYTVNPSTGASTRLATGFAGATNLAVAADGTVYVAELFGGRISQVSRSGAVSTFKTVAAPLALETQGAFVYAATFGAAAPDSGMVLRYKR